MAHLGERHFPILPDVTEIKFEHSASQKRCVIKRKQVPIEPGFAITAHKAQGQTMARVVVDLAGCAGTERPYVMVSRSTSLEGLMILRDFDYSKVTRRHSEDLRKELKRLECLRLKTIVKIGSEDERREAKRLLTAMQGGGTSKKRERSADERDERPKRTRLASAGRVMEDDRPVAGATAYTESSVDKPSSPFPIISSAGKRQCPRPTFFSSFSDCRLRRQHCSSSSSPSP